jgi:hypothetical protein
MLGVRERVVEVRNQATECGQRVSSRATLCPRQIQRIEQPQAWSAWNFRMPDVRAPQVHTATGEGRLGHTSALHQTKQRNIVLKPGVQAVLDHIARHEASDVGLYVEVRYAPARPRKCVYYDNFAASFEQMLGRRQTREARTDYQHTHGPPSLRTFAP